MSGALPFSRKHPLSCWFSSMLVVFAGSLLANALMGEPTVSPCKNNNQLLLATAVWLDFLVSRHDSDCQFENLIPS